MLASDRVDTMARAHHIFLRLLLTGSLASRAFGFVRTPQATYVHHPILVLNLSSKALTATSNEWQFHVAPMQCYTNAPLRTLFRTLSDDAILWTEMEKTTDLLEGSLEKRFGPPGHKNIVLQLGGNDPLQIRNCLERFEQEEYTFAEVNLNCGCPSIEAGGAATYGASLMTQPGLTKELLQAIVASSVGDCKTSLKCRIAVAETMDELDARSEEQDYVMLHNYVQHACEAG